MLYLDYHVIIMIYDTYLTNLKALVYSLVLATFMDALYPTTFLELPLTLVVKKHADMGIQ